MTDQNRSIKACLVIDDPLLTPRYGCIRYEQLINDIDRYHFFVEIAFIPWNYNRSDDAVVSLLSENNDKFALCVHGCNHTYNEFGTNNLSKLIELAKTAIWRMEKHRELTGLGYEPIMVFPQGLFSKEAMEALKLSGYSAAVNSTLLANGAEGKCELDKRAFTTSYSDLPLFRRRYPKEVVSEENEILSEGSVILVEHHRAFKNGSTDLVDTIRWLNDHFDVEWLSLGNILKSYGFQANPAKIDNMASSIDKGIKSVFVALRRYMSEARDNTIGRI